MWPDSVQYLNRYPNTTIGAKSSPTDQNKKIRTIDPDEKGELYGEDEISDQKLLQSCWNHLKAGEWNRAMEAFRDANQSWRCVTNGGVTSHYEQDRDVHAYALWKRRAWQACDMMMTSKRTSVQYESAILAIWANHTQCAFQNPIIFKNTNGDTYHNTKKFLTMLWIHYRAISERCMEELHYYYDSSSKINYYNQDQMFQEQLQDTKHITKWQESDIVKRVLLNNFPKNNSHEEELWISAIASILQGSLDAWVKEKIEYLLHQTLETNENYLRRVRFVVHVLLYLRLQVQLAPQLIDEKESCFLTSYITNQLIHQPMLWSHVTLYATLLPRDDCWNIMLEFWMQVHDPKLQCMLVQQAREHLPRIHNGNDTGHILLVQAVIRETLKMKNEDNDAFNESTWFSVVPLSSPQRKNASPLEFKLEQAIEQTDIRKMQSLSWFEHIISTEDGVGTAKEDADRWVCINILMRQFLLQTYTTTIATVKNNDKDWIRNCLEKDVKFYTARLFLERYLPTVTKDIDSEEDDDTWWEFEAMATYLQSQTDFISWHHTLVEQHPVVTRNTVQTSTGKLENEILAKMERKEYCDNKRYIAKIVISAANKAKEALLNVLTYDGGWLLADEVMIIDAQKKEEWSALRNKCLPHVVHLLFYVLNQTAEWMQEFVQDIQQSFGEDEAASLFSRIDSSSKDESLLAPASWHRMSLDVASIIVSKEYAIIDCLSSQSLEVFMSKMADISVALLTCTQEE